MADQDPKYTVVKAIASRSTSDASLMLGDFGIFV